MPYSEQQRRLLFYKESGELVNQLFLKTFDQWARQEELEFTSVNDQQERFSAAANMLVELAGFDQTDSDNFGLEYSRNVHSLLMIVMMHCPELAEKLNEGEI